MFYFQLMLKQYQCDAFTCLFIVHNLTLLNISIFVYLLSFEILMKLKNCTLRETEILFNVAMQYRKRLYLYAVCIVQSYILV